MIQDRILLAIPHFNDSKRLKKFLPRLVEALPGCFDILVSDDGSRPEDRAGLLEVVAASRKLEAPDRAHVLDPIFAEKNQGKGAAVKNAWIASKDYQFYAFVDADGAVSAEEVLRATQFFLSPEGAQWDALIASRVKMLGRSIKRSWLRHLSGRVFATLVSELGRIPAYDTQCGFKMLRKKALNSIVNHLRTPGFAFDVEMLLLMRETGCQILEFPVDWQDIPGSKVHLLRDSWRMALEVIRIKNRIKNLSFAICSES